MYSNERFLVEATKKSAVFCQLKQKCYEMERFLVKFKRLRLKKTFNGNLKAVSPVIATIIIVAIAITMSIAVAYWLLGLGSSFTKFEKVEFTTAYADVGGVSPSTFYTVDMNLKNTGSAVATIDPSLIMYNGKPATAYATTGAITVLDTSVTPAKVIYDGVAANTVTVTMQPGGTASIEVQLTQGGTAWVSGMTVEIMLHTTGGKDYPKVITLP